MKLRLQVILSVVFATLAVTFSALWVRSYLVHETIVKTVGNHTYYSVIHRGRMHLGISRPFPSEVKWETRMRGQIINIPGWPSTVKWTRPGTVRYWYFVLATALLAASPWMRARYSLRTLLIVTTVAAVAIGFTIATS